MQSSWWVALSGSVGRERLLKMGLTVIVPYLVSTFSSVAALKDARRPEDA